MWQNVKPNWNETNSTSDAYIRNKPTIPTQYDWLCLTAKENNSTVRLDKVGAPPAINLEVSTDGVQWVTYTWNGNTGMSITLSNNGKVYFRGDNDTWGSSISDVYTFVMTGNIEATGNIASLYSKTCSKTAINVAGSLFKNCTALTKADIFYGLRGVCNGFDQFFRGCTGLTSVEIPNVILTSRFSMGNMFTDCTNLSRIKVGFHSWVADKVAWVSGVVATGTFICPSDLPIVRGTSGIPTGWKVERESAPQADWDESDSSDPAYIKNKPNFSQADWDESDSSDPSYIKGNPTQEYNKGLKIRCKAGSSTYDMFTVPTTYNGMFVMGRTDGTTIINGGELQLNGQGKGISWIKSDNDINITCNNIKKSNNMPNTAGGFAIVDSSTGKLPASIIPSGEGYDTLTSNTLTGGHKYLITPTTIANANFYFYLSLSSGEEVEFHVLVESPWTWNLDSALNWQIGDEFKFGFNTKMKRLPVGLFKYKIKNTGSEKWLYNQYGQVITTDKASYDSAGNAVGLYVYSGGANNSAIPLSNEYMNMPFGGFATPVTTGYANFGLEFDPEASSEYIDFSDGTYSLSNKYLHLFSRNPVCNVGSNTIDNFSMLKTVNEPVTITFVGNSSSHVYMGSSMDDLFASNYTTINGNRIVRLTTWCQWDGSSYWVRYFIKEGTSDVFFNFDSTLPLQSIN